MLGTDFAARLHKRMFGDVWRWAGTYRTTARNIGVDAYRIGMDVAQLMDDVRYWAENMTYPADEIGVRLHHRLVIIHPFSNGNGRHSRLMADLLIERLGARPFSWRGGSLADTGELRRRCVEALRAANGHDVGPLLIFARS
jgi:Fic-DOC domain mobile mystery protein B